MGGLTSLAGAAMQALSIANTVVGAVDRYKDKSGTQAYDQQKAINDLRLKQDAERAALEKEKIRLDAEQAESARQSALRRAVARQRARFGASGISSNSGSAQALLLGLFDESEDDLNQRTALDTLKAAAIDQGLTQQQRINTLQLTQLRERNRMKSYGAGLSLAQDLGGLLD